MVGLAQWSQKSLYQRVQWVPLKSTEIYDWHPLVLSPVTFTRGGKIIWKLAFEIIAKIYPRFPIARNLSDHKIGLLGLSVC